MIDLRVLYINLNYGTPRTVSEVLRAINPPDENAGPIEQLFAESPDYKKAEALLEHLVHIGDAERVEMPMKNSDSASGYQLTRQGDDRRRIYLGCYNVTHSGSALFSGDYLSS